MSKTINIIGHKSPDLDSVAAAVAYAYLKNKLDSENKYVAKRAGEVNAETKYAFEKFGVEIPKLLENAAGQKLILVDHNEKEQIIDGFADAEIVEVVDHHKIKFEQNNPIFFHVVPIGSTCSILTRMYEINNIEIPKDIAGIMLSAALIDTVITKSPTSTKDDIKYLERLSLIVNVDYKKFGMELYKIKSDISSLSLAEILENDQKDFDVNGKKFNVGQIETVDLSEVDNLKSGLFEAMKNKKKQGSYHTMILFITDIIKEGSQFLVLSDEPVRFEQAFGAKLENNECYLAGVLSRKKQVVPPLMDNF